MLILQIAYAFKGVTRVWGRGLCLWAWSLLKGVAYIPSCFSR